MAKLDKKVSVNLTEHEYKMLQELSNRHNVKQSDIIRQAIHELWDTESRKSRTLTDIFLFALSTFLTDDDMIAVKEKLYETTN